MTLVRLVVEVEGEGFDTLPMVTVLTLLTVTPGVNEIL